MRDAEARRTGRRGVALLVAAALASLGAGALRAAQPPESAAPSPGPNITPAATVNGSSGSTPAANGAGSAAAGANGGAPRPFAASYSVIFKGMNAGTAALELTQEPSGRYSYVSRNQARGLFRLFFPGEIIQKTEFEIVAGQVRPLRFVGDDGTSNTERDVRLDFDWPAGRVRGVAEQRPVDVALRPGVQDAMSVQIALMIELAAGRRPELFWMIDKDQLKDYAYAREGEARIDTPLGRLDTVIWGSRRPGSDRVTRIWYAPALGWTPVRAERTRGGKLEWSMQLQKLRRGP